MSKVSGFAVPWLEKLFFSPAMRSYGIGKKTAFIAVFAAFSVVSNFLEIKLFDLQFSFTLTVSVLTGIFLGGGCGFVACFVGDVAGFFMQSAGQMYLPWIGISTGTFALLGGWLYHGFHFGYRGETYVKLAAIAILTFLVCTVGINSTGFYFYNKNLMFSEAVRQYAETRFGGEVTYLAYVCYRLFFKGQIWNSVVNYALVFVLVSLLRKIGIFRPFFASGKTETLSSKPVNPKTE